MKFIYPICLYEEEDMSYTVDIPDLGCATEGSSLVNAFDMAEDAIAGWILDSLAHGEKIPPASSARDIKPDDGGFVSLVVVDLYKASKKRDTKTVKKTLTIPSWVNAAGEKHNINFSATLTDAILNKIEHM